MVFPIDRIGGILPLGHVRYVSNETAGPDMSTGTLFKTAVAGPIGIALPILILVALIVYILLLPRLRKWGAFRVTLHAALSDYLVYVPWILRLSAGIALMGSGLAAYMFVPHLEIAPRGVIALAFTAAGFMILVGVAVRLAALLALVLWGFTFATGGFDAFMASEVVAALVALTALSAGRPSVDDLLSRVLPAAPKSVRPASRLRHILGPEADHDVSQAFVTWAPVVLRVGLGLSLLYAGFAEKLLDPGPAIATAIKYDLAVGPVTPELWVVTVALIEIVLGLGLIIGSAVRPLSALAFIVLTLTLFALPDDPVVAHVPLWGIASAVFILGCGPWSVDRERMRRVVAQQE